MITIGGKGPAPKVDGRSVRRNAAGLGGRVIVARPVQQPALPPIYETNPSTGKKRRVAWPAAPAKSLTANVVH